MGLRFGLWYRVMTPADCVRAIREYVESVPVTHFYSRTVPPGLPPEWCAPHRELFGREVIACFR